MTDSRPTNLRQAHWGIIDQALSAGTNFALTFLVVRAVSSADFGAFSLVYVIYILVLGLCRATGTTVLAIEHAASTDDLRREAPRAAGFALGLGVGVGVVCLAAAAVVPSRLALPMVVLGFGMPLLLLQDALRGILFALREPRRAAANDAVWALAQFGALIPLLATVTSLPVWGYVATWVGGSAAAAVFGMFQLRVRPVGWSPVRWFREHRLLTRPLLLNEMLTVFPAHLTYLLLPLLTNLRELGVIRASYMFFGPLSLIYTSLAMLALPDAVRTPALADLRALVRKLSGALTAVSVAWGVFIVLMPTALGRQVLGDTWNLSFGPRALLAVSLVAEGVLVGPWAALGSLRLPQRLTRVRVVAAPLTLVASLVLARGFGATGVAGGFAIGYWVAAVLAWRQVPRTPRANGRHAATEVQRLLVTGRTG